MERLSEEKRVVLPELVKARIEQQLTVYCVRRVPLNVRHLVRLAYKIRDEQVTLVEVRVVHDRRDQWVEVPISQFRFDPDTQIWTLFSCDQSGRWFVYRHAEPARDLGALLHAVELDVTRIFWG